MIFLSGIRNHCILLIINKVTKTISFNDREQLSDFFGHSLQQSIPFRYCLAEYQKIEQIFRGLYIVVAVRAVLVAETSA